MSVTVSGYAALDRALLVDRLPVAGETVRVRERLSSPWPEAGGAAHVARAVRRGGADVGLVSWVGADQAGDRYVSHLDDVGVDTTGVARAGTRSPAAWLFYDRDGRTACCFDPGRIDYALTAAQRERLHGSDWWVVAVEPSSVTRTVLDGLDSDARLAWVVKADREAFPPALAERLLERCDVLTFSAAEREYLESVTAGGALDRVADDALVIETHGDNRVRFRGPAGEGSVPVEPVACPDTTGAGDTLAGAVVAARAAGKSPRTAVEQGVRAAHRFLRQRQESSRD